MMPRYEFLCETCQKSFELIMTIAERDKATPKCPTCKGTGSCPSSAGSWPRRRRRADPPRIGRATGREWRATLSEARVAGQPSP
jgi:putative FmdB family regulatory protein